MDFDYTEAFSRNIGWITKQQQLALSKKRIAIAGMGGVGGSHLLTLTRLGVGKFNIADFDHFELANFNRQAGASMSTIKCAKAEVLYKKALDINPNLEINIFNQGINTQNTADFLCDVDLYVDGLDFFAVKARRSVFATCADMGIPAITAAPLGMGTALLNFIPGKMTFEEYFLLKDQPENEQLLRFFVGLAPKFLHQKYLVDPTTIDLENHKGPSTPMGCELCAGVAATQALKILLNRGKILAAPHAIQFDAFENKMVHTWRPGGNNNPINKFLIKMVRTKMLKTDPEMEQYLSDTSKMSVIEKILDSARWAPSGDNSQPWRFEILTDAHVAVHCFDTRDNVVYDLQGHASQISIGALLETISIAATDHKLIANISRRTEQPITKPIFDIHFDPNETITNNPLSKFIVQRTVQRRPMKTAKLTTEQKQSLEKSLPEGFSICWLEGFSNKFDMAKLMFLNDKLRLSIKEAYDVHKSVIEWNTKYSKDKIPEKALGVDYVTARLMQWTLKSWGRVSFMNKYLAGTLAPRIQLAFIPALACGAHFVILSDKKPNSIDDFTKSGRALQNFWLTATQEGLGLQPEYTPLVFHEYSRDNIQFSEEKSAPDIANDISEKLAEIIGKNLIDRAVYLGRIGQSNSNIPRSVRLDMANLVKK